MHRTWRTFLLVWFGQFVSIVGTGATSFALGVWVYQATGQVTSFALVMVARALPVIVLSPYAGVIVDRYDRKWIMIVADSIAALSSLGLAVLFFNDALLAWHIYIAATLAASAEAFHVPAYQASVTVLVNQDQYARANGLIQMAQASADIISPLLAGFIVVAIGLTGVFVLDFLSFGLAVGMLLLVRFPTVERPVVTTGASMHQGEFAEAVRFVRHHAALQWLLLFFGVIFFIGGFINAMVQPMVLAFTTPDVLGIILSGAGVGFLIGGMVLSAWRGPRSQIKGVLLSLMLFGVFITVMGSRPAALLVGICAAGAHFCFPFINAYNQAIWQRKVPVDLQGRTFALRQMLTRAAQVSALLIAGPLADYVFNPLLTEGGLLAHTVGQIIGTGLGRGNGLIFTLAGLMTVLVALAGWRSRQLRGIEDSLPDIDVKREVQTPHEHHT
jgi:MFS transporter, DHA3 family, macrolide efflux protein